MNGYLLGVVGGAFGEEREDGEEAEGFVDDCTDEAFFEEGIRITVGEGVHGVRSFDAVNVGLEGALYGGVAG